MGLVQQVGGTVTVCMFPNEERTDFRLFIAACPSAFIMVTQKIFIIYNIYRSFFFLLLLHLSLCFTAAFFHIFIQQNMKSLFRLLSLFAGVHKSISPGINKV